MCSVILVWVSLVIVVRGVGKGCLFRWFSVVCVLVNWLSSILCCVSIS